MVQLYPNRIVQVPFNEYDLITLIRVLAERYAEEGGEYTGVLDLQIQVTKAYTEALEEAKARRKRELTEEIERAEAERDSKDLAF